MKKRFLAIMIATSMALSMVGCGSEKGSESGSYTAGTYTVVSKGHNGDMTVDVTFTESEISNIEIKEHVETAGISDPAINDIPKSIIETQSTEVEVVTGATVSSKAIIDAVNGAMKEASGIKETIEVKDGAYIGLANGKNGEVKVEVNIKDKKIESVKVLEHKETIGFERSFEIVEKSMIETNSVDVDTVTSATMSSGAMIRASVAALEEAGFASAFAKATSEVSVEEIAAEQIADVIVIGAGGAGMNAAIEARATGAKVIVLEKAPLPGGNTKLTDGVLNASETVVQKEQGLSDSNDDFYKDTMAGGDNINDPELVRTFVDNTAEAIEYLRDTIGVNWYQITLGGGHTTARGHFAEGEGAQMFEQIYQYGLDQGVEVVYNTKATEIITDENGKVVGVKAENNGKEVVFKANNGVVLATGGFGRNEEVLSEYDPNYVKGTLCTNSVLSTGDGIGLAEAVGANFVGMEYIQKHPTCNASTGELISSANSGRGLGTTMIVNKEGKRFVEELERRDVISNATAIQTDGVSFSFFTEKVAEETNFFNTFGDELEKLEKEGQMVKADTIEEACAFFGIDYKGFMETLERYNEFAKNGKDEDFSRREGLNEYSTTEGPFYFIKSAPAVHHTMGGVQINSNAEVLNEDGKVIPNFYAAGEVTGGVHGSNRLGGNAIADLTVFGRIAGQNAAKAK